MFHYIKGKATMKFDGGVIIESGDIGYEVFLPDNSSIYLAKNDETILVYTAMIFREDDVSIYGFAEKESLDLFRKLMTVNGVGAKAAMAVLSAMPITEVKNAIAFGDVPSLTRANGIGKKSAERIILELKDKIGAPVVKLDGGIQSVEGDLSLGSKGEAVEALIGLGYSRSEAMAAMAGIEGNDLSTEEYIKLALKRV